MRNQLGKIKFYNETKGFGFVICAETKEELFFFQKSPLRTGDEVIFGTKEGRKGIEATSVSKY